jgi:hypothetical protein
VSGAFAAARIRVVQSNACAVSTDGRVACWGQVEYDDDSVAVERRAGMSIPHVLEGVTGAIDVVKEWHYVCVAQRPDAGDGGCFVTNDIGRAPPVFPSPPVELQAGRSGICARHADGRASCFVDHRYDNDDDFLESLPAGKLTVVPGIAGAKKLTGQDVACVITTSAEVWCWDSDAPKPWRIAALSGATALGANHLHTCAVKAGAVWCWGDNFLGQLGIGAGGGRIRPEREPVAVKASFKAVKVGTGRESSCALDDQGKVWC